MTSILLVKRTRQIFRYLAEHQEPGALAKYEQRIEAEFPGSTVFSLPSLGDAETRRHVELGVRAAPAAVKAAMAIIREEVPRLGFSFSEKEAR
mgnify:CR=1 FL=1